jgi:hypothetical protein
LNEDHDLRDKGRRYQRGAAEEQEGKTNPVGDRGDFFGRKLEVLRNERVSVGKSMEQ